MIKEKTKKTTDIMKKVALQFAREILSRQINSNITDEQLEYIYHSFKTYKNEDPD